MSAFVAEDPEWEDEYAQLLSSTEQDIEELSISLLLSGKYDRNNAILSIHSGAGGTEAMDWAESLLSMYIGFANKNNMNAEIIDLSYGKEAGIKSATLLIKGKLAYGLLRSESGVHRVQRISRFGNSKGRQTSFASVDVIPEVGRDQDFKIQDSDIRIDRFKSSGPGGQHMQKTDSAIRITHIPSGIVVTCQSERSQHKNIASAMSVLRSRLAMKQEEDAKSEIATISAKKRSISFGHQIRSYTFQPFTLVVDHRTNIRRSDIWAVIDGDIDDMIWGAIEQRQ